jgi:HK97 family phage major capsid protein
MSAVSIVQKGTLFGRYIKSLIVAKGDLVDAAGYAAGQGSSWDQVTVALKAAVVQIGTDNAGALIAPLASDFAAVLRAQTIVGRMAGLVTVPFNARMLLQNAGATASWLGENKPVSASALNISLAQVLTWAKVQSLTVHTRELARFSNPSVETILTADVTRACALAIDSAFIDYQNAGIVGVRPAAVTHGAQQIASTGKTVANIDTDLANAIAVLTNADVSLDQTYWVMRPATATSLAKLRGSGGVQSYPGIGPRGGTLLGIPVLCSNAVGTDESSPGETFISLIAADQIAVADDGAVSIDVSQEASVQMDSAPGDGAQQSVSLFQANLIGLKAGREINWAVRRAQASAVITGVGY